MEADLTSIADKDRERESDHQSLLYYAVPAIPTLTAVERLSGQTAGVVWVPLTPDIAKGLQDSGHTTVFNNPLYCEPKPPPSIMNNAIKEIQSL